MPNKTSKKKRVVALPKIPKELIDQMVSGPGGHLKIPHLWPGQNPPVEGTGFRFLLCSGARGKASSCLLESIAFTSELAHHGTMK